ncbi:MAG: hypothetical protein ACOVQY_05045 [Erythrobacter sp.]|jgi:hypothetical protein
MSDSGLWLAIGAPLAASGLVAIIRPASLVRESRRNWEARLRELDAGAPEAFFEERRELEAYPPRFDPGPTALRWLGGVGLVLGMVCLFMGLTG